MIIFVLIIILLILLYFKKYNVEYFQDKVISDTKSMVDTIVKKIDQYNVAINGDDSSTNTGINQDIYDLLENVRHNNSDFYCLLVNLSASINNENRPLVYDKYDDLINYADSNKKLLFMYNLLITYKKNNSEISDKMIKNMYDLLDRSG